MSVLGGAVDELCGGEESAIGPAPVKVNTHFQVVTIPANPEAPGTIAALILLSLVHVDFGPPDNPLKYLRPNNGNKVSCMGDMPLAGCPQMTLPVG